MPSRLQTIERRAGCNFADELASESPSEGGKHKHFIHANVNLDANLEITILDRKKSIDRGLKRQGLLPLRHPPIYTFPLKPR